MRYADVAVSGGKHCGPRACHYVNPKAGCGPTSRNVMIQPDRTELLRGFRLDLKVGMYCRRRSDARQPALQVVQPTKTTPRTLRGQIDEIVLEYSIRSNSSYRIENYACAHMVLLMGWGRSSLKDEVHSLVQFSELTSSKPFTRF